MKTNVYIDGFNLYYRAVKDTPYKWLDLAALCQALLPSHQINRIRYFTALVQARPNDPGIPVRQQTYLRALGTIPNLTVHFGQFKPRRRKGLLATPIQGTKSIVEIETTEEKGSDVNLATYLLIDGFDKDYEQAVVISNDSDLALPIDMVRKRLGLPIGVVNPNLDKCQSAPNELLRVATFTRRIRANTLRTCQFTPVLKDTIGIITKPATW